MSRRLPLSLAAVFFASLAQPVVLTLVKGLLQVLAKPNMRARVLSLQVMIAVGVQPFAALVVGFAALAFGSPAVILVNGRLMAASAAVILLVRPGLREWDPNPDSAATGYEEKRGGQDHAVPS